MRDTDARRSGDIPEHWPRRVSSTSASVGDNAAHEQGDPDEQPRQRVQVLIASTCPGGLPAGRTRTGTLKPSDVEEKDTATREESERGTADRRPRSHQPADQSNRPENEYTERHEPECSSTSNKRPRPEPAAVGEMCTKHWLQSSHPYFPPFTESIARELRGTFPDARPAETCC
jgi:hypothetical protein